MKNKAAQALGKLRHKGKTKKEISEHMSMMGKARGKKIKKYGWNYWQKKDKTKKQQRILKSIIICCVLPATLGFLIGVSSVRPGGTEVSGDVVGKSVQTQTVRNQPHTNFCELNFIECD